MIFALLPQLFLLLIGFASVTACANGSRDDDGPQPENNTTKTILRFDGY